MRLGVVVDSRRVVAFEHAVALGASALSIRVRPTRNQRPFLKAAKADHNLAVLGVLDRNSFRSRLDWRGSAETDIDHVMALVEAGLLDAIAIGHEPDDGWQHGVSDDPLVVPRGGVGSWVLPLSELAELIMLLRNRMREVPFPVPLVLGGLCSWRHEVLDTLDLALLDGILIHPYRTAMEPETALAIYLNDLVAKLAERGLTDRVRLGVGELGRFDQGHQRGEIADWFARALTYLAGRGDVDCCFVCCDSDLTLDGFGQFDVKGRAKPSVASIFDVALRLPAQDPLFQVPQQVPEPEATPEPAVTPDWDDPHFTPEQIAGALASIDGHPDASHTLTAAVRTLWPEFSPYLAQFQVSDDPAPRVALLAALYIATAGRLVPITEGGSYTRAEHRYGGKLGNLYHGDGWRYRGRGLVRTIGRSMYAHFQQELDLPLLDEPDLVLELPIAAGVAAFKFSEQGLFEAALRGNWVAVWRGVEPGLQGYSSFLSAVQALLNIVETAPEPEANLLGPAALGVALTRVGDPYTLGGDRPGGFDGLGLVTWAYTQVTEGSLPTTLEGLATTTSTIGMDQAQPGDLVLYEYGDPATGGSRYDHIALLVDQGLVLDARAGSGVGYRPHVRGAIRRYRRVTGPGKLLMPEEGEMAWEAEKAQLVERIGHLSTQLAAMQERLEQGRDMPEQPTERAPKKDWLEWGQRVRYWREHQSAELELHFGSLRTLRHDLESLTGTTVPLEEDKPEPQPEGADDGQDE